MKTLLKKLILSTSLLGLLALPERISRTNCELVWKGRRSCQSKLDSRQRLVWKLWQTCDDKNFTGGSISDRHRSGTGSNHLLRRLSKWCTNVQLFSKFGWCGKCFGLHRWIGTSTILADYKTCLRWICGTRCSNTGRSFECLKVHRSKNPRVQSSPLSFRAEHSSDSESRGTASKLIPELKSLFNLAQVRIDCLDFFLLSSRTWSWIQLNYAPAF